MRVLESIKALMVRHGLGDVVVIWPARVYLMTGLLVRIVRQFRWQVLVLKAPIHIQIHERHQQPRMCPNECESSRLCLLFSTRFKTEGMLTPESISLRLLQLTSCPPVTRSFQSGFLLLLREPFLCYRSVNTVKSQPTLTNSQKCE